MEDVSLWEVNEAFAATAIVFLRDMGLDSSRVNIRGGAVALGHPIGFVAAQKNLFFEYIFCRSMQLQPFQ